MNTAVNSTRLAQLIVEAQRQGVALGELDEALQPKDFNAAYQTQQAIFELRGIKPGGWKIGSKSHTGPIQGSPLPAECIHTQARTFNRVDYAPAVLELEIAFRFNRDFAPQDQDYSDEQVHAGIGEMAAAVEIVASRFAAWPKVEPLTQLADLLNHGALVVGAFVPYREDFPFAQPSLEFLFNDHSIVPGAAANPAGDPRRLLPWLVNHHTRQGLTLAKGLVITTGSFTGMYAAQTSGKVVGVIEGLPAVKLDIQ